MRAGGDASSLSLPIPFLNFFPFNFRVVVFLNNFIINLILMSQTDSQHVLAYTTRLFLSFLSVIGSMPVSFSYY